MLIEYDLCTCIPRTVGNEELWNIYCRGLIYFTPAIQWSNDIEYHRLIITNAHTLARTAFDNPYSLYVVSPGKDSDCVSFGGPDGHTRRMRDPTHQFYH